MRLQVKGKNVEVTPSIRAYAERNLGKLEKQLAEQTQVDAAGLSLGDGSTRPDGPAAAPPGWDGEQQGEAGIHGVPRARRWDAVVTADAPGVRGDAVHFVTLEDRTIVDEEDEPDD